MLSYMSPSHIIEYIEVKSNYKFAKSLQRSTDYYFRKITIYLGNSKARERERGRGKGR